MKTPRDPECPRAWDIPEYLAGRLDPASHRRMQDHVRICPECAKWAAEFRPVLARLEKLSAADAARVIEQPARRSRLIIRLGWAAALVLLATLWASRTLVRVSSGKAHDDASALLAARTWLAQTQEPDGSWDVSKWGAQKQYRCGLSALAIMAYMAAVPREDLPNHMGAVERCAAYLLSEQQRDGRFGPFGSCTPYNHALCTLALLEAHALAPRPEWKEALDRALAYIETRQGRSGAWGYPRRNPDEGNSSITIWNIRVLQRAETLGWMRVRAPLLRAYAWLQSRADETGRVGYRRPRDFPFGHETLTAGALLCALQDPSARSGMPVKQMLTALRELSPGKQTPPTYIGAYFLVQALDASREATARAQAARWRQWLARRQSREGPYRGSCEPDDRWSAAGGHIYATAMATLAMAHRAPEAGAL